MYNVCVITLLAESVSYGLNRKVRVYFDSEFNLKCIDGNVCLVVVKAL